MSLEMVVHNPLGTSAGTWCLQKLAKNGHILKAKGLYVIKMCHCNQWTPATFIQF